MAATPPIFPYRFARAAYHKDANKVPYKVDILGHKMRWLLERKTLAERQHDPAIFALRT